MLVYLRDGSAQTVVCADALRQKFQIKLSISPSHSVLTPVLEYGFVSRLKFQCVAFLELVIRGVLLSFQCVSVCGIFGACH